MNTKNNNLNNSKSKFLKLLYFFEQLDEKNTKNIPTIFNDKRKSIGYIPQHNKKIKKKY